MRPRLLRVTHVLIGPKVLHALGGAQRRVAARKAHRWRRDTGQPVAAQGAWLDLDLDGAEAAARGAWLGLGLGLGSGSGSGSGLGLGLVTPFLVRKAKRKVLMPISM